MLYFFLFVIYIFLIFQIMFDIFRSEDLNGGMKAFWVLFIIFFVFLGVLVYLIARGGKMHERQLRYAQQQQAAMDDYIRSVASSKPPTQS